MTRPVLSAVLVVAMLSASSADDESNPPAKLVDFFRPGMKLAVRIPNGTDCIDVTIITSDEFFAIAKDSTNIDLDDLAAKYAIVERVVDVKRRELTNYMERNRSTLRPGMLFGEPEIHVRRPNGDLGTVQHIGTDFITVSFDSDGHRRRLYSTRFIRTIDWYDGELKVFGSVPRVRKTEP